MEPLIQFFGRLHPMVLHAPIGLLIGLVALEAFSALRRRPLLLEVRVPLAWLVAVSAVAAAGTGFVLGRSGDFAGDLVDLHRWLGIGAAVACVAAAVVLQRLGARPLYFAMLAVATGATVIAGHKGAGVTHGEDFLFEPFHEKRVAAPVNAGGAGQSVDVPAGAAGSFVRVVRPILEQRCFACHGPNRQKAGLALHTPAGITRGGDFGPVVTPGHPEASEIVRRMKLDIDDDEHMPPGSKPQPTPEEIKAIEEWISAGAPMSEEPTAAAGAEAAGVTAPSVGAAPPVAAPLGPPVPSVGAMAALREKLVHVAPVAQGSHLLSVDLGVAPTLTEADAIALLTPLRENVAELSAARLRVGDTLAALAASMPNLRRLDLSGTDITDAGVASLADAKGIEDLVLTRTRLTSVAAEHLALMTSLKRAYLWNSGVSVEAANELREALPGVTVDLGETVAAAAVETETEVKLSGDAPVPGAAPAVLSAADALKPVNTLCPVSGKPIDGAFAIVYKGKVVAFCCRVCLGQFLDEPAKFEGKIN